MNVVLCECAEKRAFTAGNKARTDTVQILIENGYKHIPLYTSKSSRVKIMLDMLLGALRAIATAGKDEVIFIQYPYYPAIVNKALVQMLGIGRAIKGYKIYLLVHDAVSLRSSEATGKMISQEVKLFNKLDRVICHNQIMQEAFNQNGCTTDCVLLGPFDYLYQGETIKAKYSQIPTVIIAGNLAREKCGYIYELDKIKNCSFALYGINYKGKTSGNIVYRGAFPPDELIQNLDGSFGLVWDGESIESCLGDYGNYLKYNNPHKFSLYIAAGLPLIVWSESALATYVQKYNLGICVKSLKELEKLSISEADYNKMRENVLNYRKEIVNGEHLIGAINRG